MATSKVDNYRSDSDDESFSTLIPTNGKINKNQFLRRWQRPLSSPTLKLFVWVLVLVNLVQAGFILYKYAHRGPANPIFPEMIYSPAGNALKYEKRVFDNAFPLSIETTSIYQREPSPEVDDAWTDLYNGVGILRIPASSAKQLPNETYPFTNDPGYYIASLAVFHHLHCLNLVRQALNADYYRQFYPESDFGYDGALGLKHSGHCVEIIRQALMCSSDVSTIVWQWNPDTQQARPRGDVTHTCRSFDAIYDWAKANQGVTKFVPEAVTEG